MVDTSMHSFNAIYKSPLGNILLTSNGEALTGLKLFVENQIIDTETNSGAQLIFEQTISQLQDYFVGKRQVFTIKLALQGTEFQLRAWQQLQKIPYGQTWSYKDMAAAMGCPKSYRAVGNANGKNPIAIIIPCHRVIQYNGNLGGYNGGVNMKKFLLENENTA